MSLIIDSFGRSIDYLRLSVTDRCNYRCFYCMPEAGLPLDSHHDFLDYEELTRLVRLFSEMGVHKVRLTGGEPLVRRNLVALAEMINALPEITDLSLSTNGHLLDRFALPLRLAGIRRVNISLDSLDANSFARITHGGDLDRVIRGIDAACDAGMEPIKINMVVMKDINEHETEAMLDFAVQRDVQLRFIETMPVGTAGNTSMGHYYPADEILKRVRQYFRTELIPVKPKQGAGPARIYRVGATNVCVGVISAISRHFCAGCNRVRLTARGDLHLCLGQDNSISLRDALRNNNNDEDMKKIIRNAIAQKPRQHNFNDEHITAPFTNMSSIGG